MENPVIIFGANPIGRAAQEIFEQNGVVVYGFLDDDKKLHQTEVDDVVVLGATDDEGFLKLIDKKCQAFIALDDNRVRKSLVKMIRDSRHVQPVNAVHRSAYVSSRAQIGHGNLIDNGAILSPGVKIGNHNLLNAGVVLGVGTTIGDFVQVGIGSLIQPGVTIGDDVFVGAGVTLVAGITIGKGARIGAGSVVIAAVKEGETVFGNPAQRVKAS
jgi:sugar O-acyltransferase (sialic acid O-acetyltransferase NeuD family)